VFNGSLEAVAMHEEDDILLVSQDLDFGKPVQFFLETSTRLLCNYSRTTLFLVQVYSLSFFGF